MGARFNDQVLSPVVYLVLIQEKNDVFVLFKFRKQVMEFDGNLVTLRVYITFHDRVSQYFEE